MALEFNSRNIKVMNRLGPRGAFGLAAMELPETCENVIMCNGDVRNFAGLDRFATAFPDRYYSFGIAEQNMLASAAGLASEGFIPYVTSYAAFDTLRCADQIKVCMSYMKLNIKLVGMDAGFAFGIYGHTHMCTEDIALMRTFPNISIISPADALETAKATLEIIKLDEPVYMRLTGVPNMSPIHSEDYDFRIGKAIKLRDGEDAAIIGCGSMVSQSLAAASLLETMGISTQVWNMHTIRPLDQDAIAEATKKKLLVTAEEHSIAGGLGDAVSLALDPFRHPPFIRIGVSGAYPPSGTYEWLLEKAGLTPENIASSIKNALEEIK